LAYTRTGFIGRAWRGLPWDGQGFSSPREPVLAELQNWAARKFWRRVPAWSRPLLVPLCRVAWGVAALWWVWKFGWDGALFREVLLSGARPEEVWIWRLVFPSAGPHLFGGTSAGRLLSQIGAPAQHRLLTDKLATSGILSAQGLAVPVEFDPDNTETWVVPRKLFTKPRRGAGGRGAASVDVLPGPCWRINGGPPVSHAGLQRYLTMAGPDLIVQERLFAADEIADLASDGVAPVLRLTTARVPGGAAFLHSALISIAVPGERPRNFIRGHIRAAVGPDGRMSEGIWFAQPARRFRTLPWNSAAVAGRLLPEFTPAVRSALAAMELVPDLALVNWDLILTARGPLILEGNTCGNWILTNLGAAVGIGSLPLEPLLREWARLSEASAY
jgi:hypothetical protein